MIPRNRAESNKQLAKGNRSGFTLAEVLVTVAIVTVLAAVLLPTIAGQIFKGDSGRVVSDLQSVRGAAEQFLADVRRYPRSYSHLSSVIVVGTPDLMGSNYNSVAVSRWKGPYVTKDLTGGAIATGFGGSINSTFGRFTGTNADYLTVVITGIDSLDFQRFDAEIDGPSAVPANQTTGQLRWNRTGGIDSTKYYAIPIQ